MRCPEYILIHDPKNNLALYLFCAAHKYPVHIPGKVLCSENVKAWFINPENALEQQGYLDPSNRKYVHSEPAKSWAIVVHTFSKLVDKYIHSLGIQTSRQNPCGGPDDLCVTIPGYVKSLNQGTPLHVDAQLALFVYIFRPKTRNTCKCFHRNLELRPHLVEEFMRQGYLDVETLPEEIVS